MSVRLTVKQRSEQGGADKPSVVMLDDDIITLGRDQACQVVLAQQAVSRSHARISRDGTLFFVEDLGSRNGIKINKKRSPGKTLQDRDEVEVGSVRLLFLDPADVRESPVVLPENTHEEDGESTAMETDDPVRLDAKRLARRK